MITDEYVEELVDEYLNELSGREGAYMFTADETSHDVIHRKVLSFMTTKLGLQGVCITLETEADFLNLLQHIDPSKVHFINKYDERQNKEHVKVTLLDDEESIEEITQKLTAVLAKTNSKFVIIKSLDRLFAKNRIDTIVEFVEKLIGSLNSAGISVITIARGQQMTSNLVTKTRHDYNKTIHM
jgi:hypothetical protein